jgi:hypothetical protein
MGLDLYAGTLTRYYSGRWQTIVQQQAAASGKPATVIRQPGGQLDLEPDRAQEIVTRWRSEIEQDLAKSKAMRDPFDWPETLAAPYFTDKPDWHCFGAMVLLAAYTETGTTRPAQLSADWGQDRVLRRMEAATNSPNADVRYPNLYLVQMWFPVSNMGIFNTLTPVGKPVRIGSLLHLVQHLMDLNERTYAIPPGAIQSVSVDVPPPSVRDFDTLARAGLTLTMNVAINAMMNQLPMLLDY